LKPSERNKETDFSDNSTYVLNTVNKWMANLLSIQVVSISRSAVLITSFSNSKQILGQ